jgi:hypothetical protein
VSIKNTGKAKSMKESWLSLEGFPDSVTFEGQLNYSKAKTPIPMHEIMLSIEKGDLQKVLIPPVYLMYFPSIFKIFNFK